MTNPNTQAALDANLSMLDAGWEDIALPPEYATFPSGVYLMECQGLVLKTEDNVILGTMSLLEAIEADESMGIAVPATNSLFSARFNLASAKGNPVGEFRRVFEPVAKSLNANSPREFMEQAAGLQMVCSIVARRDKQDTTKIWNNINRAYTLEQYEELVSAQGDSSL